MVFYCLRVMERSHILPRWPHSPIHFSNGEPCAPCGLKCERQGRQACIYRSICHSVNAWLHIEGARCGEKNGGGVGVCTVAARAQREPRRPSSCTSHPVAGQRSSPHLQDFTHLHYSPERARTSPLCVCQTGFAHCLSPCLKGMDIKMRRRRRGVV